MQNSSSHMLHRLLHFQVNLSIQLTHTELAGCRITVTRIHSSYIKVLHSRMKCRTRPWWRYLQGVMTWTELADCKTSCMKLHFSYIKVLHTRMSCHMQILVAVLARGYDWSLDLAEPMKTFPLPYPRNGMPMSIQKRVPASFQERAFSEKGTSSLRASEPLPALSVPVGAPKLTKSTSVNAYCKSVHW